MLQQVLESFERKGDEDLALQTTVPDNDHPPWPGSSHAPLHCGARQRAADRRPHMNRKSLVADLPLLRPPLSRPESSLLASPFMLRGVP